MKTQTGRQKKAGLPSLWTELFPGTGEDSVRGMNNSCGCCAPLTSYLNIRTIFSVINFRLPCTRSAPKQKDYFHTHKTILKQLVSVESVVARKVTDHQRIAFDEISMSSDKHTQASMNVWVCICFQAHLLYGNLVEQTHNSSCAIRKQQVVDL